MQNYFSLVVPVILPIFAHGNNKCASLMHLKKLLFTSVVDLLIFLLLHIMQVH